MSQNLYEDMIDAEVTEDCSRLVVYAGNRAFLKTLDGIEFGMVTFDGHEEDGATFLNNEQNHDKIKAAGYSLMVSSKISEPRRH